MSIVIVGGHDRMVGQYKKICKSYKCKCKVFTQMEADFGKKIGCPDLLVLLDILMWGLESIYPLPDNRALIILWVWLTFSNCKLV